MTPRLSYIVCCSPRSGSWVVAEGLHSTGVAGNPKEWFNDAPGVATDDSMETYFSKEWGIPLPLATYEPYLAKVIATTVTKNGVFGLTSHRDQFTAMEKKLKTIPSYRGLTAHEVAKKAFPNLRYIHLTRRDKIRQAISYCRALQTSVWHVKAQHTAATAPLALQFDPVQIAKWEQVFERLDANWHKHFSECGQTPLVLHYEDVESDYVGSIKRILDYLDIDTKGVEIAPPLYKKQADATTDEWAQRYFDHKHGKTTQPAVVHAAPKANQPPPTIPPTWKRWIAENKLLKIPDRDILAILKNNGMNEKMAMEELQAVGENPYFQAADSYTQLLHKRDSFAMIQRSLSKCDPKTATIERRSDVSRSEFLEHYYAANRPVILCGLMTEWKARKRWTPEYLEAACGVTSMTSGGNELFNQPHAKSLSEDIEIFREYLDSAASGIFLWYGPKGTVTPLHHEQVNILMAQVYGRQRITLIPAAEMDLVYNDNGVYSAIDVENPDYTRFPKFREATVIELELAAGEVLFLPVGWWHHMRALDSSITVAFTNFLFPNRFNWAYPKTK